MRRGPILGTALFLVLLGRLHAEPLPVQPTSLAQPLPPTIAVLSAAGTLAAADAPPAAWRMLAAGDRLADTAQLRTAADGPARLAWEQGRLVMAADSHLALDPRQRTITLERGALRLELRPGPGWTIAAGAARVPLGGAVTAEVALEPGRPLTLICRQGQLRLPAAAGPVLTLNQNAKAVWEAAGRAFKTAALEPDDGQPFAALAADAEPSAARPPVRPQGLGQLVVQDAQSGAAVRLEIARCHANIVLQPPMALVQLDESFYNPGWGNEEGTFVFNLPPGASVSRFAMNVTRTEFIEGEIVQRQQASQIYESIVRQRRDPAILEQIGRDLFRIRVFPVPAHDTKRILLDFTVPLEGHAGHYDFRLPLLNDLLPIWDFQLQGSILGPTQLETVASRSHPDLKIARAAAAVTFRYRQDNYRPQSDFTLSFTQPPEKADRARTYVAEPLPPPGSSGQAADDGSSGQGSGVGGQGGKPEHPALTTDHRPLTTAPPAPRGDVYFLANVRPQAEADRDGANRDGADVLIVADTSSLLRDQTAVRQAAATVVHNLRPGDRFRLASADETFRPLDEGWTTPGTPAAQAALARLQKEFGLGLLRVEPLLKGAAAAFDNSLARRRLLVVLGNAASWDGQAALEDYFGATRRVVNPDLWQTFRSGRIGLVNVLLRNATDAEPARPGPGGASLRLDATALEQPLRPLLEWLLAGLPSPVWVEKVRVEGAEAEDLFAPAALAAGDVVSVSGRMAQRSAIDLEMTYWSAGRQRSQRWTLAVDPQSEDVFVGRAWAQQRIEALARQLPDPGPAAARPPQAAEPSSDAAHEMVELSTQWNVLSPQTAFLVLENEHEYQQHHIARHQRRRYWKPPEAVEARPLPDGWRDRAERRHSEALAQARKVQRLDEVRNLVASRDFLRAQQLADQLQVEHVDLPADVRELLVKSRADAARQLLASTPGPARWLLDDAPQAGRLAPQPRLDALLAVGLPRDYLKLHPFATALLREKGLQPASITLSDLVNNLAADTGANVFLDRHKLEGIGVNEDTPVSLSIWGRMALRDYVKLALDTMDLALVEEPYRLLVTTREEEDQMRTTQVYPVDDLVNPRAPASPLERLIDPELDRQLQAQRRINAKLDRLVSVDFVDEPLRGVVDFFRKQLDDTMVLETRRLEDAGHPLDKPIRARWKNVPLRESLRWVLAPLDLDYTIDHGALVLSSAEVCETRLHTRTHSLRGLLTRSPLSSPPLGSPQGGFGSGLGSRTGGFGGMGGGMISEGGSMGGGNFGGPVPAGPGNQPAGPTPASGQAAGMGDVVRTPATDTPSAAAAADGMAPPGLSLNPSQTQQVRAGAAQFGAGGSTQADYDTPIDVITSTIKPTSWDAVGGPGSIAPFEPALAVVVNATDRVHEEIDDFLNRLRQLPPVPGQAIVNNLSDLPPPPLDSPGAMPDFDTLIDLITSTVTPTSWDAVGGPGCINAEFSRCALIVSQIGGVHDQIYQLLTLLRRERYELLTGKRPWEGLLSSSNDGPVLLDLGPPDVGPAASSAAAPTSTAPPLPSGGAAHFAARWICTAGDGAPLGWIALRRAGPGWQIDTPDYQIRLEGPRAAVAYPGLRLVERGPWVPQALRLLDGCLPWLPHRGMAELAGPFDVTHLPDTRDAAGKPIRHLRLTPPAAGPQKPAARTCLEVAYDPESGLPVAWQSLVGGQPTQHLRFEGIQRTSGQPQWRKIVLENGRGQPRLTWQLDAPPAAEPAASQPAASQAVPRLDSVPEGYLSLDAAAANNPSAFLRALTALRQGQWTTAAAGFRAALQAQPGHPLLQMLWAWCAAREPQVGPRAAVLHALSAAAAGPSADVRQLIVSEIFFQLDPAERYAVLTAQPMAQRSAADWQRLAEAALAACHLEEAAVAADTALQKATGTPEQWAALRTRLQSLLRLEKTADMAGLVATARRWPRSTVDDLRATANLLARQDATSGLAVALFGQALALPDLPAETRRDLLIRRAGITLGPPRWRSLLAAAELLPAGSADRREALTKLVEELPRTAQGAAYDDLLGRTADVEIRHRLLLGKAHVLPDAQAAAEICQALYRAAALPEAEQGWACNTFNAAGRPQQSIDLAELVLRAGKELPPGVAAALAVAYTDAGRPIDARRAAFEIDQALDTSSSTPRRPTPPRPQLNLRFPRSRNAPPSEGGGGFF